MDKLLLSDKQIKDKLQEIQPEGFDWATCTESEMIKFRAIAKAEFDHLATVPDERLIEILSCVEIPTCADCEYKSDCSDTGWLMCRKEVGVVLSLILPVLQARHEKEVAELESKLDRMEARAKFWQMDFETQEKEKAEAVAKAKKEERERIISKLHEEFDRDKGARGMPNGRTTKVRQIAKSLLIGLILEDVQALQKQEGK